MQLYTVALMITLILFVAVGLYLLWTLDKEPKLCKEIREWTEKLESIMEE